jgi:hypothetical protein
MEKIYRKDLPPMPERILRLPVERGYPVPWFVAEINGVYDFRIVDAPKRIEAIKKNLCWICGERLGASLAFNIGPMCAINRVTSEPPAHRECAVWAAKACPFLTQQQTKRRGNDLPADTKDAPGISISRQPGVVLVWITENYRPFKVPDGFLISIGAPVETLWFREARTATRAEIMESIESGLPILRDMAKLDGIPAERDLEEKIKKGLLLVPSDEPKPKVRFGVASRR